MSHELYIPSFMFRCEVCGSKDLVSISDRSDEIASFVKVCYDKTTQKVTISYRYSQCFFPPEMDTFLFICSECDTGQITEKDIIGGLNREISIWLLDSNSTDFNEFLAKSIWANAELNFTAKVKNTIDIITDSKILAKLRLAIPTEFHTHIIQRHQKLKQTNPLLEELELLVGEKIPRVHYPEHDKFSYFATDDSILGLNLIGKSIKQLPKRISLFPNLRYLILRKNQLHRLPDKLDRYQRLEIIDISENKLEKFPKVLLHMTSLDGISIANNPFQTIPSDIEQLALSYLVVDQHQFDENKDLIDNLKSRGFIVNIKNLNQG